MNDSKQRRRMLTRRWVFSSHIVLALSAIVLSASEDRPTLERAEIRSAATELAVLLEDNYLFPEIGAQYAAHLRHRAAEGGYDAITVASDLAATFEAELNAVHADGHLRVRSIVESEQETAGRRRVRGMPTGDALAGARWYGDEDVAYVAIQLLPGDEASQKAMARFLDEYSGARALILDLRSCPGGTLAVMDVLFSHLYSERVHLVTMDTRTEAERRGGEVFEGTPTLTQEAAPDGIVRRYHWSVPTEPASAWSQVPVYVLTGNTGSACEHLSMALKASGRATLIGTPTGGAGHYGGLREFGDGQFDVFVPVGWTYDPRTGEGWEGGGVAPHIETPAGAALDRALAELGLEPEVQRTVDGAEEYVGLYGVRRITLEDGHLHLQRIDVSPAGDAESSSHRRPRRIAPKLRLRLVGEDEFDLPRIPGARVRFERDSAGQVVRLAVRQRDGSWEEAARSREE